MIRIIRRVSVFPFFFLCVSSISDDLNRMKFRTIVYFIGVV